MTDDHESHAVVQRGMAAQAARAPEGSAVAERIISTADAPQGEAALRRTPRWRGWVLPAVAAGGVALLTGAVLTGSHLIGTNRQHPASTSSSANPSHSVPAGPIGGAVPAGFRPVDLSFVNQQEGWALGSVPCHGDRCTQIVRTRDGGATWVSIPAPPLELPSNVAIDPVLSGCNTIVCVSRIHFATAQIGYVASGWQLFMTDDGGASWRLLTGGESRNVAIANGTLWRITNTSPGDCPETCGFRLQSSPVGSASWRDVTLPSDATSGTGVELTRSGRVAVLEIYGKSAGSSNVSTLLISSDDGASWTRRGEPCPQTSGGADRLAPRIAPDGSISVLCRPRSGTGGQFVATSTDAGATFRSSVPLGGTGGYVLGTASSTVLFASTDTLYRSANAGKSWQPVPLGHNTANNQAFYVDFQTTTTGHILAIGADQLVSPAIWTTTDAGASWTRYTFR
jgi:photosystem II stability/assembly factor-like uncharacterized protein